MLDRRAWSRAARLLSWIAVVAAICWPRAASAYPWMIRHEYQGCVPCHADPSGAGLLTEYGRAMGENVLRSRYGSKPADELPVYARFLFGVPTPEWLLLGGSAFGLLRKTGQDPTPWKPTPSLVFAGPYRFTRNPMYVGMTAMQVGIAGGPRKRVRAELQVGRPVIAPFRDVQLCKALHIWRLPQP